MPGPPQGDPAPVEAPSAPDESTGDLGAWRGRWESGQPFAIPAGARGLKGRISVLVRRLLNPLVRALWKRQSAFNLSVIDHLESAERARADLLRDLRQVRGDLLRDVQNNHRRISHLEAFKREGFGDVMQHSDALYAVVDQKLDRYRSESQQLWARLGGLLASVEAGASLPSEALESRWREQGYRRLEDRFRGTQGEIAERVEAYLPLLPASGVVLDLGCGRGEALAVLSRAGLEARGVDLSREMVEECRRKGLTAEQGDLLRSLGEAHEESLAGIVSLHVIEHLPGEELERLLRLSWRALRPGGALILETPNPMSIVVAARNFWRDPTHQRPVHPDTLAFLFEETGFVSVERLDLRPFNHEDSLPEIDLGQIPPDQRTLGEQINRIRDRLDELLFGFQDYAMVGRKPVLRNDDQSSFQTS